MATSKPLVPITDVFEELSMKAGQVFLPSAPIAHRQLFAGRIKQLSSLIDAVGTQGQHVVVYGERGVGKTSLVSVAQLIATRDGGVAIRNNCHNDDTFARLWKRAFDSVVFAVEKRTIGFGAESRREVTTLASSIPSEPTPHDVIAALRKIDIRIVFVFDEFDQLHRGAVAQGFAETIKALSDHNVASKVVIVGVGDNIDALVASHASIERAIVQIRMPRMEGAELNEIIATGAKVLDMTWDAEAARRVVNLSQGLPHYVHRLALFATRDTLRERSRVVTMANVKTGMRETVDSASQSLTDAYLKATSSQRKDSLFRPVLLACALTRADDLGYFRPAWVKRSLAHMGEELDVPAFASHLNKFSSEERGQVLQKTGVDRQWRYRFANPLIQPYVIMRGLAEGVVTEAIVDSALAEEG